MILYRPRYEKYFGIDGGALCATIYVNNTQLWELIHENDQGKVWISNNRNKLQLSRETLDKYFEEAK